MFSSQNLIGRFRTFAPLLAALALALAGTAHAQSGDLALLSGGGKVPPNVMLVFDTSGSMQHMIWHDDFDKDVAWDGGDTPSVTDGAYAGGIQCYYNTGGGWATLNNVRKVANTAGQCPGSGFADGSCADSEHHTQKWEIRDGTDHMVACQTVNFPQACPGFSATDCFESGIWTILYLRDLEPSSTRTWLSYNYLHWYLQQLMAGPATGFPIPMQTRNQGAKVAVDTLINDINPDDPINGGYTENVKFGLAHFADSNGGFVVQPIASGNKVTLLNVLAGLQPNLWTPLSETMVDVGRYFVGEHQNLGAYSQYNLDTSGNVTASPPKSPINVALTCENNFAILLTDGNPTQDLNNHHNGTADFMATIGDWDGDGDATKFAPGQVNGVDDETDWLDDVTGYLYNTDLIDDAIAPGTQNIATYTVGFAVDLPLLQEAALNGGGSYYTTGNAKVLAAQLKDVLQEIIERSQTFSAASVPSSRTAFGDGFFTAYFQPRAAHAFWAGHMEAYRLSPALEILGQNNQLAIDPSTGAFIEPRIPIWDTGLILANGGAQTVRNLHVTDTVGGGYKDFSAAATTAAEFNILASDLPLYPAGPFATQEALADALATYLYGADSFDDDGDGDIVETRDAVLGDIFHSSPVVIATPPPFLMGEEGFGVMGGAPDPATSFFARYAFRDRRLYVGANDGMFHAIRAGVLEFGDDPSTPYTETAYYDLEEKNAGFSGGHEAFGYVPSFLMPNLKNIPIQNINNKTFFVDGDPSAADGWLPANANDVVKDVSEWATVAITGMRGGGNGYLGLDISDPAATYKPYPGFLWEFLDADLGETWSKPVISRVRIRGGPGGDFCDTHGILPPPDCKEVWVAIFAGGYTETGDAGLPTLITNPSDPAWEDAGKAIFMVDLKTGAIVAKLEHDPADAEFSNMTYAFPSAPAVLDIDFDGFIDLVYVGDTGGQVWKWDVSEIGLPDPFTGLVTNWKAGRFFSVPVAPNGHHRSLFNPPTASFINGRLTLAFGTGERTDMDYISNQSANDDANRFYVMEDPDPKGATSIPSTPYGESDVTDATGVFNDPDPTDLGFYIVAEDGEKFVTNNIAFAGFVISASFLPDQSAIGDPCTAGNGQAFLYIFSLDDGGGFFSDDGTGPLSTRRLSLGSGIPTDPRITTTGTGSGNKIFVQTSDGSVASEAGPDGGEEPVGLVYWRQQL